MDIVVTISGKYVQLREAVVFGPKSIQWQHFRLVDQLARCSCAHCVVRIHANTSYAELVGRTYLTDLISFSDVSSNNLTGSLPSGLGSYIQTLYVLTP